MLLAASWLSAIGIRQYRARTLVSTITAENADNYKRRKFFNSLPSDELNFINMLKTTIKFIRGNVPDKYPAKPLPVIPITDQFDQAPSSDLRFTWLGHSSVILEIEGIRLLIDPILSERSSMVQWAGPKRFQPAPLSLENLPEADAILISHDHFDHLDKAVIRALADRELVFLVPIGVGRRLSDWGVDGEKIIEMNWWNEFNLADLKIVATPARHFSGRGLLDRDMTLWTSWSIIGNNQRIFFSGDTGLTPEIAEIGQQYGPFDLTFIEIGAYDDAWSSIHAGPVNAIKIHQQLKGDQLVPIHWATFDLALHSWYAPAEELIKEAAANSTNLITPMIGEIVNPAEYENKHWWQQYMYNTQKSNER